MDSKSGILYSFAALTAVSMIAHTEDVAAASTHTVRSGDTLWSISRSHDISISALKSLNGLTSDRLTIGQSLRLTAGNAMTTASVSRVVTTDALNLRLAGGTWHRVLLTIPKDETLIPIQSKGSWTKVSYKGTTGWVHNGYLRKTSEVTPTSPPTVSPQGANATTRVNLNLRSSRSTKTTVLLTIPKGKTVTVLNVEGSWSKVSYGSRTGYVASRYLTTSSTSAAPDKPVAKQDEVINESFITTANLNVRQGAGTGYALVTTIPTGTNVTATKKSGDWYYVTYGSKSGYVSAGYLKKLATAPSAPVTPNEGDAGAGSADVDYIVNTPSLNVRASASTNSAVIGSVKAGQILRVVQTSNGWHQIYIGNTTGFVSADYIKQVAKDDKTDAPWVDGTYNNHTYYTYWPTAIRSQASESSSIIGSTLRGELLNVIGETATHYRLNTGFVRKGAVTEVSGQSAQATRLATIAAAQRFVGTPYVWGSSSPDNGGFDCSGLIYYVFNQANVSISRTNVAHYWSGTYFGLQLDKSFVPQAGDLVFFENTYTTGPSHMGIMVNADTFIHAGSHGLGYNSIHKDAYWQSHLLGFKRP